MDLDITGSIAQQTAPLSAELLGGSLADGGLTGSSAIDTIAGLVASLPAVLLGLVAGLGGDLGSTFGTPLG